MGEGLQRAAAAAETASGVGVQRLVMGGREGSEREIGFREKGSFE